MKKKSTTENLIIVLVFALTVFHTFTFLQNYYSYIVTLLGFLCVLVLCVVNNGGTLRMQLNGRFLFLSCSAALLILEGLLIKGETITYLLGAYLPYMIWPLLYSIVEPLLDHKNKNRFLWLFLVTVLISVAATLSVLATDNEAARLLAGSAKGEIRAAYYSKGVGGYGFVYGCCFLVFGLIMWLYSEKNILSKAILFFVTLLTAVMILYSSYTTALLLTLILVLLTFYSKSKSQKATLVFVLAAISIIALIGPILSAIHQLGENLELEWIVKRTEQLLDADESGSLDGLRRTKLYRYSWEVFKAYPLTGWTKYGGHSMFLDHLARYGVMGGIFAISYFGYLLGFNKKFGKRVGLVYWGLIVLCVINTVDTMVMLPMVLFVLPLMLSYQTEDNGCENRNTNPLLQK